MGKKVLYFFLFVTASSDVFSDCEKCKIIREANAKLPPPKYEYYDDYIKATDDDKEEKFDFLEDEKKNETDNKNKRET